MSEPVAISMNGSQKAEYSDAINFFSSLQLPKVIDTLVRPIQLRL